MIFSEIFITGNDYISAQLVCMGFFCVFLFFAFYNGPKKDDFPDTSKLKNKSAEQTPEQTSDSVFNELVTATKDVLFLYGKQYHLCGKDRDECFDAIMNQSPILISCKNIDSDFRYVYVNKTWIDMIGDHMLGKTDFDIHPLETAQELRNQDEMIIREKPGTIHAFSSKFLDQNGKVRWGKVYKVYHRFHSGMNVIFCYGVEQTDEYEIFSHTEMQKEFLQCILDHIPACIVVKDADRDFRYLVWNNELEIETGLSRKNVIGKTDAELYPEPWENCTKLIQEFDKKALKNGEICHEQWYKTANGQKMYIKTRKRHLKTVDGKNFIIDMCLDSTRERQIEERNEEIINYQKDLIRKSRLFSECLTYIAKEMDYDNSIKYLMKRFAEEEEADRCYIYYFRDYDCRILDCVHEWNAEGITPVRDTQQNINVDRFPEILENFANNHEIIIDSVDDYDMEDSKIHLQKQQIKSLILLPLHQDNRLCGFVGLDFVLRQRFFSESDVRAIRILANLIEIALQRKEQFSRILLGSEYQTQYFNNVPVYKFVYGCDEELLQVNTNAAVRWPKAEYSCLHKKCEGYFCNSALSLKNCPVQKAFLDKKPHRIRIHDQNGTPVIYSAMPICNQARDILFVVETIDYVADIEEAEQDHV